MRRTSSGAPRIAQNRRKPELTQEFGTRSAPVGVILSMTTMMMTNERKIWEAALLLVRRHGAEAVSVAEREASGCAATTTN